MKEIEINGEEHWCSRCDCNMVHSESPETGKYYIAYGHVYAGGGRTKGDYEGVVFAICTECLNACKTCESLSNHTSHCFDCHRSNPNYRNRLCPTT